MQKSTVPTIPLTKALAKRICDVLSESEDSIIRLCELNQDFPPHYAVTNWSQRKPWFAEMYRAARQAQAEFLIQKSIDLAKSATPQNAHAVRIKFDVARWYASKLIAMYGEKPVDFSVNTNVSVGISLPQSRLEEIRGKMETIRQNLLTNKTAPTSLETDKNAVASLTESRNGHSE